MSIAAAIARGIWNKVQGLISSGYSNVANVIKLAAGYPVFVSLTEEQAGGLEQWAKAGRSAADAWFNGEQSPAIPTVPVNMAPDMMTGDDGTGNTYQWGMLIKPPDSQGSLLITEAKRVVTVDEMIDRLIDFQKSGDATGTLRAMAQELVEDLYHGDRSAIVPLWLVIRVGLK